MSENSASPFLPHNNSAAEQPDLFSALGGFGEFTTAPKPSETMAAEKPPAPEEPFPAVPPPPEEPRDSEASWHQPSYPVTPPNVGAPAQDSPFKPANLPRSPFVPAEELIAGLNPEQRKAVEHIGSPLLIIAGAGSGKTAVLTRRIAYLMGQRSVSPGQILAITFTNKAAAEMRERVTGLVGPVANRMWVATFHSPVCGCFGNKRTLCPG